MATRPRVHEFDVSVSRDGTAQSALGGSPLTTEAAWWAEHLLLTALVRCSLALLRHAARRAALAVSAKGSAHGRVTKREDGLYAFVEIEARFDVQLTPAPANDVVASILRWAERGCFVGNSLATRPRYRWFVNGEEIAVEAPPR